MSRVISAVAGKSNVMKANRTGNVHQLIFNALDIWFASVEVPNRDRAQL
jgi:hypothetical protein